MWFIYKHNNIKYNTTNRRIDVDKNKVLISTLPHHCWNAEEPSLQQDHGRKWLKDRLGRLTLLSLKVPYSAQRMQLIKSSRLCGYFRKLLCKFPLINLNNDLRTSTLPCQIILCFVIGILCDKCWYVLILCLIISRWLQVQMPERILVWS